jgi:hypothetical protein
MKRLQRLDDTALPAVGTDIAGAYPTSIGVNGIVETHGR